MKSLWLKISVSFSLLTLTLLIILWFIIATVSSSTYTDLTRERLMENAEVVAQTINASNIHQNPDELRDWIEHFQEPIQLRFTVIDGDGTVLADSENAAEEMDNHADRPEVEQVLDNNNDYGESIRQSDTEEVDMMYIAMPIYDEEGETTAVARTSYSLALLDQTMSYLWQGLAVVLGLVLLVSAISAAILARSITRPIGEVVNVTRRLSEKDYSRRVHVEATGEISELSESVNSLAASLQQQMNTINENEKQLSSILSNLVSGVMLVNENGEVEMLNSTMERVLSQHKDHITGKQYNQYGENIGLTPLIDKVFEENDKVHEEVTSYHPQERVFDTHITPYYGDSWRHRGVIVVLHDITEIRRLEQMRRDFVANVSHELKTPVTSLKGFSETLMSGEVPDEETERRFLNIIHDESERLDRLIRDLLHLSRIERKESPLDIEEIELNSFIDEIAGTQSKATEEKNINIRTPDPDGSLVIEGDRDRLYQIILNLIANAINYSAQYGEVDISVKDEGEEVHLIVADEGIGIPEESVSRIFERFYRVDKARSRHSGGTGLGLAIVKHLVESHKGQIKLDSVEGEGTTFTLILPKRQN